MLKVGPKATALIHHFEQCRLKAYRDSVGVPTIGWGSTYYLVGRKVQMGDELTQDQADYLSATILERDFAGPVRNAITRDDTTAGEFGAMVALAYNIGMGNFRKSSVLRRHNADAADDQITEAFLMWDKAGGKALPGLRRRRQAEAALYRSDMEAVKRFTQGQVG